MQNFDESDQAGLVGDIMSLHLQSKGHNGTPQESCPFCKAFILYERPQGSPLESYRFILLDMSDNGKQ